ncbi:hypothetical protein [Streptomyces aquilus]
MSAFPAQRAGAALMVDRLHRRPRRRVQQPPQLSCDTVPARTPRQESPA